MTFRFQAYAPAFLACCVAALLATGLYQRVANPELHYHMQSPATATQTAPPPDHDHPPLGPEDTASLGQAMNKLRATPGDVETLLEIAAIFSRNRDWINAVTFLERAVAANPSDMRPRYFLGVALASQGRHAMAAKAFEETLALSPANDHARFNLGILYRYYLDRPDKALELFTAVAESPEADESLRNMAQKELAKK